MLGLNDFLAADPDDGGLRCIEDRELIQGLLCFQLLEDTDQRVGNDDRYKGHVPEGADQEEQDRQKQEDQVEVGDDIAADDLPHGFGGRVDGTVVPSGLPVLQDLFLCQADVRIRFITDDFLPYRLFGRCLGFFLSLFLSRCHRVASLIQSRMVPDGQFAASLMPVMSGSAISE